MRTSCHDARDAGYVPEIASLPWAFVIRRPAALTGALEEHVTTLAAALTRSREEEPTRPVPP
jgi:hypothetical protein